MEGRSIEIEVLENKLKLLNDIWVSYFFTYPFFQKKVKFTEEEKTNYVGVIFGYFRDSFDVVFATPPECFSSYVEKFTYQIALLQSIYVQQDLTEELLRIFKTGINRDTLNDDPNFKLNRDIRNELVGHPISRNKDFSLRSSTVFGYEKSGNSIHYLKYEFPEEKDVVQTIEINDLLTRHMQFLNEYLDKLLEKSYSLLSKFNNEVLVVLEQRLKSENISNLIQFCTIHFKGKFDSQNEIKLAQIEMLSSDSSHPRYGYSFQLYLQYISDFLYDINRSIEEIISKKRITPRINSELNIKCPIPNIVFVDRTSNNYETSTYVRKDYDYELGKIYSKRNLNDFEFHASSIISENMEHEEITNEIEYLRQNLNDEFQFNCGWNYIKYLTELKLKQTI
jgi:hypothetical protein